MNEDRLVIGENLFGVFDGAASLSGPPAASRQGVPDKPPGRTGGSMAASIAGKTFAANHFPLTDLGRTANTAILNQMKESGVNTSAIEEVWSTSAAVVRIKGNDLEWFQTGDSHILVIYEDGSHSIPAQRDDHDFETLTMMKAEEDNTLANPVLKRQVLKVRAGMNKKYGVLNGDPAAMAFASGGTLSLDRVEAVLLFTDGLNLPAPVPEKKKCFTPLALSFRELGLKGLHRKIRVLEEGDPDRRAFPRFKRHDDIAAIALHLKP
ncbi:MAG: protein phosphatase 2C domain-containing protein [Desulfobacterales bacterium]|nr:protein phosphatase 2C domain-containing protein [Desulfobacterales bacterium]